MSLCACSFDPNAIEAKRISGLELGHVDEKADCTDAYIDPCQGCHGKRKMFLYGNTSSTASLGSRSSGFGGSTAPA